MEIHNAAQGFAANTDRYEKARPTYPEEAISYIIETCKIDSKAVVVDVGAGTGKFSRSLVDKKITLIAIEPVKEMIQKFKQVLPSTPIFEGTAEKIPLENKSVDVITAAQAFHWFANHNTLQEFNRILKPEGYLCLIWNSMDEEVEWIHLLQDMLAKQQGNAPRYREGTWKKAFENQTLFGDLNIKQFNHRHYMSFEGIVERILSSSYMAKLPEERIEKMQKDVKEIMVKCNVTGDLFIPYRTEISIIKKL